MTPPGPCWGLHRVISSTHARSSGVILSSLEYEVSEMGCLQRPRILFERAERRVSHELAEAQSADSKNLSPSTFGELGVRDSRKEEEEQPWAVLRNIQNWAIMEPPWLKNVGHHPVLGPQVVRSRPSPRRHHVTGHLAEARLQERRSLAEQDESIQLHQRSDREPSGGPGGGVFGEAMSWAM